MVKIKLNTKTLRDVQKKIEADINAQQRRNPVYETDSQAVRDQKIGKWIKEAGYGPR